MDMKYRVEAWCIEHGVDRRTLPLHFIRESVQFTKESDVGRLKIGRAHV